MDRIKDITITDVDPNESDEALWTWIRDEVLLHMGVSIEPWTRYTLTRNGTEATVQLDIPLYEHAAPPRAN